MKECKLYESPGPGAYELKDSIIAKIKDDKYNSVGKTDKVCAFIEEARFVGMQTPAPKYEVSYVSMRSLTSLDKS
jgi:hypothetical protein